MTTVPLEITTLGTLTEPHTITSLNSDEIIIVGVHVRRRTYNGQTLLQYSEDIRNGVHNNYLIGEDFINAFGAEQADLDAVIQHMESFGLTVINSSQFGASVTLQGPVTAFNSVFNTSLYTVTLDNDYSFRTYDGTLQIASSLDGIIWNVTDMDSSLTFKPLFKEYDPTQTFGIAEPQAAVPLTPTQVGIAYNIPAGGASGVKIGIISLGGGYYPADITSSFSRIGVAAPTVVFTSIDGATNSPGNAADVENMLDIYCVGGMAVGCTINYYCAPNSFTGFVNAITASLSNTDQNAVVSVSWGGYDGGIGGRVAQINFQPVLAAAVTNGLSICFASGDTGACPNGSTFGGGLYPANDVSSTACGGSNLQLNANNTILSETGWTGSGGGIVNWYALPSYQTGKTIRQTDNTVVTPTNRIIPDITGPADPATGFQFYYNNGSLIGPVGGTSAAAPIIAGGIGVVGKALNQSASYYRPGWLNTFFYNNTSIFRDITSGQNNAISGQLGYVCTAGYDAVTGLGSINYTTLLTLLGGTPPNPPTPGYLGTFPIDTYGNRVVQSTVALYPRVNHLYKN